MNRRDLLKSAGSAGLATVTLSGMASAWTPPDSLSPVAAAAADWSGYTLPDRTLHYDGQPRWIVRVTDDTGVQSVRDWAGKSSARAIFDESAYAPRVTVAAPPGDVLGKNGLASSDSGLAAEAYVELVDVDMEVSRPTPVDALASASAWSQYKPPHLWATSKNLPKRGIAFNDDAQKVDQTDVKTRMSEDVVTHSGGAGVTTTILDTGCNYASTQFGSRLKHGKNFLTGATIDPANNDYSAIESEALHGTWCTVMAAGSAGFASSATVGHGKVLGDDGSGSTTNIVEGIRWATEDVGTDTLSLSLGSPFWSQAMADAIADAVGAGVVVVCATGNSRPVWTASPSDTEHTLGIGASNTAPGEPATDLQIAYFSQPGPDGGVLDSSKTKSRGARPQLVAPGMQVAVPTPRPDGSVSSHRLSGTSMATPAVDGALTVFLGEYDGFVGDPERVMDRATRTAARTPRIGQMEGGAGLLDLERMFNDTQSPMELSEAAKARDAALISMSGTWGRYAGLTNPTANYLS